MPLALGMGDDANVVRNDVPIQIRKSGCIASIVLSIALTLILNLLLRAC